MAVYCRDQFVPTFGGFVEVTLDGGWHGLIKAEDVENVLPRHEGGTCIHVRNLRAILMDVPVKQVIAALRKASKQGGANGTTP